MTRMSDMHIDSEKSESGHRTETREWPLEKLRLDPQNVRFKHIEEPMSDSEIENYIWTESDTKDLYRAILASGGLSERPYVTAEGIVREGNRRLVCLRKAKIAAKGGKIVGIPADAFDKVTVEVFPRNITAAEIDVLLARMHVSGKKQWSALNQASHLYGLYHDRGYSYERIRELLGMGKSEVIRKIAAFTATREYLKNMNETDITKYSFFEELYKKKPLGNLFESDPVFRDDIFKWIQTGKFDETGAKDMSFLLDVLKDPDVKAVFEKKGMRAARFEIQKKDPASGDPVFRSVDSTLAALKTMPRDTLKGLSVNENQVELLKKLRDEVGQVLKDAGVKI
jgi:hypothetical protein